MLKTLDKIQTKNQNEVRLYTVEPLSYEKTLLIIGVMHGDELQGEPLIEKMMKCPPQKNRLLFIPCLNPDGKELKTRQNANLVDLNRNFPTKNWTLSEKDDYYGGQNPASEEETKFVIKIIETYHPYAILTIHNPYKIVNFDGPAQKMAQEFSLLNNYPLQEDIGYPTPGSFGTYCGIERKIPTITLELPDDEDIEKLWEENKKAFEYFMEL